MSGDPAGPAAPDVHGRLDAIVASVEAAKAMPLSSSCVVNRTELLAALDDLRGALPVEIERASGLLARGEHVLDDAREAAEDILTEARAERARLVARTEVAREAAEEAERVLAEAREAADAMRSEVEDYVDAKLANFEVVLHKTITAVERGRERLAGRAAERDSEELGGRPLDGEAD